MKRIPRRRFLRTGALGLGAAAFGLPWLASTAGRGRAQGGPSDLNFVLVSIGHSIMPEAGRYAWIPGPAGAIGALPRVLQPLSAFRDRMTVVAGVDNLVARLVNSNGHNASSRTLLTCMPHAEVLNADGSLNGSSAELTALSAAGGPSIEYVMADALGTIPVILRVGERNGEHRRTFRLDATDDQGEPDPAAVFDRIFASSEPPPSDLTPREQLAARRGEILSTVEARYRALSARAGAEDRVRLESHASLIRDVAAQLEQGFTVTCDAPQLPLPAGWPTQFETGEARDDDLIAPTHNSLVALALSCQATRVVSLHYSSMQSNQFPFLNGGVDMFGDPNWHGVVHHDGGTDEQRYVAMEWYFAMLADLLGKLDAVQEGDGTLLDRTIVLFTSSLANTAHSVSNLPVLVFGGSRTGLATGQMVDYDGANRSLGDLWTTCLQLMGVSRSSFGYDRGEVDGRPFHSGVLTELFA